MESSRRTHLCHCSPFRPVAETSRMMLYVQLFLIVLSGIGVNLICNKLSIMTCIIPVVFAFILEKTIIFCRCGGYRGSTAHTLFLAMVACYILPAELGWPIILLVTAFAVLYKHFFKGMGRYWLHPVLLSVAILELFDRGILENIFGQYEQQTGTAMTMNSFELSKLVMIDGKLNIEDIFINRLPTIVDCLLGCDMPVIAASPAIFSIFGVYCIYRGYLNWRVPATYIFAVIMAIVLLPIKSSDGYHSILASGLSGDVITAYIIYQIFTGYVFFSAMVLFLDTTSRPITVRGQVWAAYLAGSFAILFRLYLPVFFAELYGVLLVGLVVPVLNNITRPPKRYT